MEYTTEDYLGEMEKLLLAIRLVSTILDDYINDDVVSNSHSTQTEKDKNTSALLYVIKLLHNEVRIHREKTLESLYKK